MSGSTNTSGSYSTAFHATAPNSYQVTATAQKNSQSCVVGTETIEAISVVKVDLNYAGLLEETETPPNEENPGGYLLLNNNDNDGEYGVIDMDRPITDPELLFADPDLSAITFAMTPVPETGTVTLTIPPEIRVWENARKKSLIAGQWNLANATEKSAFQLLLANGAYLERIETGTVDITLSYESLVSDKVTISDFPICTAPAQSGYFVMMSAGQCTSVTVDLDIFNGGSDLDNGEAIGLQGLMVPDADEISVGAYLLVNWDDDDGDGAINTAGSGWTSLPKPDLDESTVTNEDNLAQLRPNLKPMLETGTVELEVSGADKDKIKLWKWKTKETEIILTSNKKTWHLNDPTEKSEFKDYVAKSLWIEGVDEGSAERAVTFTLRYKDSGGIEIDNHVVKATVVMLNLANVVGREVNSDAFAERGHISIVGRYNGDCTKTDLVDASKYTLYESDGGDDWGTEPGPREALLTHVTACPGRDYFGSLTPFLTSYYNSISMPNTVVGYTTCLKILLAARRLIDNTDRIDYTKFKAVQPGTWNGDLSTVTSVRCDGFVEVCYEWCGVNSWGRIVDGVAQYSLLSAANQNDHNNWQWENDPYDGDSGFWAWLMPISLIGYADTYIGSHYAPYSSGNFDYTRFDYEGTYWQSAFSEQLLVAPTQ